MTRPHRSFSLFFFNDTATTEIYTLSLHDALPICVRGRWSLGCACVSQCGHSVYWYWRGESSDRSEEHTSELQSQSNLVCRLLLEKKKKHIYRSLCPVIQPALHSSPISLYSALVAH